MIRAFIGAGGKTTLIQKQAAEYRAEGKKVFVTTSTHMFIEPDTLLTDDPEIIIRQLRRTGYAMAGIPEGEKIGALSPETYGRVCTFADVVLVEADGSAHRCIKFPNATEPVIFENVEEVVVVCGLHAIGKPLREVAHRPELVMACLGASENTTITLEHIAKLVLQGYLRPLREKYPGVSLSVYPAGGSHEEKCQLFSMLKEEYP
ncbi:MAG: selenium cofactor biosynthesis protein YqeC [Faecousia sp.]